MKKNINAIIVVEGKSDLAFIGEFLNCEIVCTNGTSIPRETIDYLKEASKTRDIIVLTDPDYPGLAIRKILDENISGLKHAFVRKEVSIKHHKVGVAESTKNEVINAIENIPSNKTGETGHLSVSDLFELHLSGCSNSCKIRKCVSEHFHLGYVNSKTMIKRLNQLNISYNDLEKYIKNGIK